MVRVVLTIAQTYAHDQLQGALYPTWSAKESQYRGKGLLALVNLVGQLVGQRSHILPAFTLAQVGVIESTR